MSKRETLAETAYNSVYFDVIHSPSKWIDEIAESVSDPVEFIREALRHNAGLGHRNPAVVGIIKKFAMGAASRAREGVLNHPGPIV